MKDGLRECSHHCMKTKSQCSRSECKFWISYPEEYNCCLVSIYENGPMTLRQVGDRIGLSFARIKQIETVALKKMKKNTLLAE